MFLDTETLEYHSHTTPKRAYKCSVRVVAFPLYSGIYIGMSTPSLHRESTDTLIPDFGGGGGGGDNMDFRLLMLGM